MRLKMTWIIFMLGFMFLYGCSQKEYLLFDFLKINEYDIKKIEIRKSGYMEPVYISTEGEKIKECVKQLKSIHIVEKSNTDKDINGWMYRIVLSLSDNTIDISVNGKYINIDYNYFECDEKDIKNLFEYLEAIARPYRNEGHDESSNSRQSLPEFDTKYKSATGDGSLFVAFSLILWFNMTVKITKDDQHAKICQKEITEKSRGIAGKPWIEPE